MFVIETYLYLFSVYPSMRKKLVLGLIVFLLVLSVQAHEEVEDEGVAGCIVGRCAEVVVDDVIEDKVQTGQRVAIVLAIILSLGFVALMYKTKKAWQIGIHVLVILGLVLVGYSYYSFDLTASDAEGITICEGGECFWAAHTHSRLTIEICGEEISLGLEKASLQETHTHKEKGKLHFHETLPVDPETREITDYSPLKLSTLLDEIGLHFTEDCIGDTCNGDFCDGKEGELKFTVNGKNNNQYGEYVWKEGDHIHIIFE